MLGFAKGTFLYESNEYMLPKTCFSVTCFTFQAKDPGPLYSFEIDISEIP